MKVEDYISRMEGTVLELAEGDAEDFHTMSAPEYGAIALRCRRLASYFDAIADSFELASDPTVTRLLAECCEVMKKENL